MHVLLKSSSSDYQLFLSVHLCVCAPGWLFFCDMHQVSISSIHFQYRGAAETCSCLPSLSLPPCIRLCYPVCVRVCVQFSPHVVYRLVLSLRITGTAARCTMLRRGSLSLNTLVGRFFESLNFTILDLQPLIFFTPSLLMMCIE